MVLPVVLQGRARTVFLSAGLREASAVIQSVIHEAVLLPVYHCEDGEWQHDPAGSCRMAVRSLPLSAETGMPETAVYFRKYQLLFRSDPAGETPQRRFISIGFIISYGRASFNEKSIPQTYLQVGRVLLYFLCILQEYPL